MSDPKQTINNILFNKAKELHEKPREIVAFTGIPESDALLNDIENYPHFFVLACVMDRQIPSERAWNIPYIISQECGGPEFENFLALTLDDIYTIFARKNLHKFNEKMSGYFHKAIIRIHSEYKDNAAEIWKLAQPDCKLVMKRFGNFPGVGHKISIMATDILARDFKVPLKGVDEIEILSDSRIEKVLKRTGLVPKNASERQITDAIIKIYPDYPKIADSVIWEIGREYCKGDFSGCDRCYLNEYCPKNQI